MITKIIVEFFVLDLDFGKFSVQHPFRGLYKDLPSNNWINSQQTKSSYFTYTVFICHSTIVSDEGNINDVDNGDYKT